MPDAEAMTRRWVVLEEINKERERQNQIYPVQEWTSSQWLAILAEEVGEAARAVNDGNEEHLRTELTEVAAVAVAWLEKLGTGRIPPERTQGLWTALQWLVEREVLRSAENLPPPKPGVSAVAGAPNVIKKLWEQCLKEAADA